MASFELKADVDNVEAVATLLRFTEGDYHAYKKEGTWYVGIGSIASETIGPEGSRNMTERGRTFTNLQLEMGVKRIYGFASFNYAAKIRNIPFTPGKWPLLTLIVPKCEVIIKRSTVTVTGEDEEQVQKISDLLKGVTPNSFVIGGKLECDHRDAPGMRVYKEHVESAIAEIKSKKYTSVVISRPHTLLFGVDVPGTLLRGARGNPDAVRTFCIRHGTLEAVGFSPELVFSLEGGEIVLQPLAGTESARGRESDIARRAERLQVDLKPVVEHSLMVKEAMWDMDELCVEGSVTTGPFMEVQRRGAVQHLASRISGKVDCPLDRFDALSTLFPSVTAVGVPKKAAIDAIQRLEERPRELYSGAILFIDGDTTFEAALVLRTLFSDDDGSWIQAGAAVVSKSSVEREYRETCEKFESVTPFMVPKLG